MWPVLTQHGHADISPAGAHGSDGGPGAGQRVITLCAVAGGGEKKTKLIFTLIYFQTFSCQEPPNRLDCGKVLSHGSPTLLDMIYR